MGDVVGINGVAPAQVGEPSIALVAMLESMLADAKAGRLQSLVGTGFMVDGARLAIWSDTHQNVYEMLGALAWLQHEYVDRVAGGKKL